MKTIPQKHATSNVPQKRIIPKIGRPSLGFEAKTFTITLKVSLSEKQLWEKQAKAAGMGLREFILHPLRIGTAKKDCHK